MPAGTLFFIHTGLIGKFRGRNGRRKRSKGEISKKQRDEEDGHKVLKEVHGDRRDTGGRFFYLFFRKINLFSIDGERRGP